MKSYASRSARGFLLLEVILALAVFGIAATGFIVALHRSADAAMLVQNKLRVTRILQSALDEAVFQPQIQETDPVTVILPENDTEITTKIEPLPDIENEDGVALQEMYLITVTARWTQNNQPQEQTAQTWRYGRLYQQ